MTKEQGTMDFDFRRRCAVKVVPLDADEPKYQIIFYGLTASEVSYSKYPYVPTTAIDLPSPYADLSEGGRTRPIEDEYKNQKHFFNKRIMTREESIGGQTVQTDRDTDRVRAHDGVGGASSVAETAPAEGGVGSSGETEGEVI